MIDPVTFSALAGVAKGLISRVWPDPVQQAEQLNKLAEIEQRGDLAELQAHVDLTTKQLEINLAEAKHSSIFVAGWRPFIGWTGGGAMFYQFIVYPLLTWVWKIAQAFGWISMEIDPPPVLETGALFSIVTGMLGVGAMRSHDKKHGVDTKRHK